MVSVQATERFFLKADSQRQAELLIWSQSMESPLLALILVAAAFFTSILSAVIGMAGGIALLGIMTVAMPPAVVVPIHGVAQLFSNTSRTLVFLGKVRWKITMVFAPPLVVGVYIASLVWSGEKLSWFRPAIGAFIIFFLVWRRKAPKLKNPPLWIYAPLGVFVGFLTIFVGATGPFLAPFFLRDDFEPEEIIATKASCQAFTHVLKIPAFLSLGFDYGGHWEIMAALVASVLVGTMVGKRILHRISKATFLRLFEGALFAIAVYLLTGALFSS